MKIKTLLLGTALAAGATLFSLRQIPDPVIPHQVHRPTRVIHVKEKVTLAPRPVKVAHHTTTTHSTKLSKRKAKRKPYFLARATNA